MAAISITPEKALVIYERVFGESGRDERARSIIAHFTRLIEAPTLEDAEKVIAWWDCWTPRGPRNLRRTTRRLRRLLAA